MAGGIGSITGAAEALSPPAVASSKRSGSQHHESQGAPDGTAARPEKAVEEPHSGFPEDRSFLASMLERAQDVALSNTTTFSFERDGTDGKMYLHVKDKRTGEDLYRIPKHYLADTDPQLLQRHRVDLRI